PTPADRNSLALASRWGARIDSPANSKTARTATNRGALLGVRSILRPDRADDVEPARARWNTSAGGSISSMRSSSRRHLTLIAPHLPTVRPASFSRASAGPAPL